MSLTFSPVVHFGSRLTGWNAVKSRVEQLGLSMTDDQVKEVYVPSISPLIRVPQRLTASRTKKIKQMGDIRPLAIDDTDSIIRSYHIQLAEA